MLEKIKKKEQLTVESNGQHTICSGFIESFDLRCPTRILETLLQDCTTGRNIIWVDNEYEVLGEGYMGDDEITVAKITGLSSGFLKLRTIILSISDKTTIIRPTISYRTY